MLKTYEKNEKNVVFLQKAEVNKKNRTLAFWFNVLPNIFFIFKMHSYIILQRL